eukprot:5343286-Prymnesium_polylepis.2
MKASSGSSWRLAKMRPALAYSRTVRDDHRFGRTGGPAMGASWIPAAPVSRHEARSRRTWPVRSAVQTLCGYV